MHLIDFSVLLPFVSELALGVLTALASVVTAKACQLFKARRDGELGVILDRALEMGIAFAMARLVVLGASRGAVPVKSELIAEAATYVLSHVPQAVKALGLDGAHLQRMIEARLHAAGEVA